MGKEKSQSRKPVKKAIKKPVKKVTTKAKKPVKKPTDFDKDQFATEVKNLFIKLMGGDPGSVVVNVADPGSVVVNVAEPIDPKKVIEARIKEQRALIGRSRFCKDQFLQEIMVNYSRMVDILTHGPKSDEDLEILHRILKYFISEVSEKMVDKIKFDREFGEVISFLDKK